MLTSFCNYIFDPDRAWRTVLFILPAGVGAGCLLDAVL
jgi:hypothetical protein